MRPSDFYPTSQLYGNDDVKLTSSVDDLAIDYPDGWPEAYWFGWLRWDTAPDAVKLSGITCIGDAGGWTYTALHGSPNSLNVGYVATGFMASSLQWYSPVNQIQPYTNAASFYHDPISAVSPLMGTRFINALDPQGVTPIHGGAAAAGENRIYVGVHVTDNSGRNDITVTTTSFEGAANGIYDFFRGNLTKSITVSGNVLNDDALSPKNYSLTYTLDINSADFGKTHENVWSVDFTSGGNSFTANVWVCGFNLPVGADKLDANTAYAYKTFRVLPLIGQTYNDRNYKTAGVFAYMHYMRFDNGAYQTESGAWGSSTTDIAADTDIYTGGYYGTIDTTGVKRYEAAFDDAANYCAVNWTKSTSQTQNRIFRIFAPDEALKLFALNMRYVANNSYSDTSYGFGSGIYVPHISVDNEFLCEFLTGDFADIQDELRPWQYGDITDCDYDPGGGVSEIYIGTHKAEKIYIGSDTVAAAYLGTHRIL